MILIFVLRGSASQIMGKKKRIGAKGRGKKARRERKMMQRKAAAKRATFRLKLPSYERALQPEEAAELFGVFSEVGELPSTLLSLDTYVVETHRPNAQWENEDGKDTDTK